MMFPMVGYHWSTNMGFKIFSNKFNTLVGTFSKGIDGALSINFAPSGGVNCDPSCTLFSKCYGTKTEKRQPNITTNLVAKSEFPMEYIRELAKAARLIATAPWVRFSVFGSMPNTPSKEWVKEFQELANHLSPKNTHFPVETIDKANVVSDAGLYPRVSAGLDHDRLDAIFDHNHLASAVVDLGTILTYRNKKKLAPLAHAKAAEFRAKYGVSVKVCPAIIGHAKCGDCKLCANPDVDLVIYPKH
jgi:hypothetical protein